MAKKGTETSGSGTLKLDRDNLYFAAPWLSLENKKALGLTVPAWIYVQDPLVAQRKRRLGLEEIPVSRERNLDHGPTSARIAVVDYDGDKNELHDPARWHPRKGRFVFYQNRHPIEIGREHPDTYQFHQVNVWAIIQRILDFYEDPTVLGRPIPWAFQGNRLIVVPHAGYRENAFYDRHTKSLQFYYCGTPQNLVYTCLSHDIIAHETGHAILDGIRPYYYENSSIQTGAFHEFVADLTAILSAMRNNQVRKVIADETDGDFAQPTVVSDLAEQFGQQVGTVTTHDPGSRYFLRSAFNTLTMKDIEGVLSPHKCSNVLTGAVFEILTRIVKKHMDKNVPGQRRRVSPKLALWWATRSITRIALQALDYLPPVDVQFIDYARAVLHAHRLFAPTDEEGSSLMTEVFTQRGLGDLKDESQPERLRFRRYEIERLSSSRTAAYGFLNENRRPLCIPPEQDILVADLYATDKLTEDMTRRPREIVIEYVWREDVELKGSRFGGLEGQRVSLLCGGTLVFDDRGNPLYWARKPGTSKLPKGPGRTPKYRQEEQAKGIQRREQLLDFMANLVAEGQVGLTEEGAAGALDIWQPAIVGRQVGGALQLEVAPHLRHGRGY
jgi:hypothetical protein